MQRQQFERCHLLILKRGRRQLECPLGTEILAAAIFVISFYLADSCTGGVAILESSP